MADDKLLDRHFELFKHLTTLDSGAALVALVIYRDVGMEKADLIAPLLFLGASLGISLFAAYFIAQGVYRVGDEEKPPRWMLGLVAGFFAGGLVAVAQNALWPPVSSLFFAWSALAGA